MQCNKIFHLHSSYARLIAQNSQSIVQKAKAECLNSKKLQILRVSAPGKRRNRKNNSNNNDSDNNDRDEGGEDRNGTILLRVGEPSDMDILIATISTTVGAYALQSSSSTPSASVKVPKGYMGTVIGRNGSFAKANRKRF